MEEGSSAAPQSLSISSRSGNTPSQYIASLDIEFTDGFESGPGDEFTAYIAPSTGATPSTASWINGSSYRYGFNGKENDNEVKGEGNQQDYGMRIYDPRLGRFLSVDPLTKKFAYLTPYQFASNSPIGGIDLDGLEFFKKDNTQYTIDYKAVVNAPSVLAKADNAAHNAMSFVWNVTLGAALEGVKSVNNYFAGGYKEPSTDIVAGFNQWQTEAYKYHTTTPIKQQLKDFSNTATDLRNYELPAQLLIAHKFSAPTTSVLSSGEIINARMRLATNWGIHSEYINFEKQVYSTTIESTEVLYQYRIPGTDAGSYFVKSFDIKPENVGLLSSDYSEGL